MRLTTERTDHFQFGPDEFWDRIGRVGDYQAWWPWLRQFDARSLVTGEVWVCAVQPPVPYAVWFTVTLEDVIPNRQIDARIDGDITGTARLTVASDSSGCRSTLTADLAPDKRSLRVLSIAARPIVRFGHRWVLETGVRQFSARSGQGARDDGPGER